jgi:hypothetical protein
MLKRFMVVAAAMVVLLAFTGCDTNNEQQRAVVTVYSMNCNAPAYGDVMTGGGYADTFVPVVLYNRPYNSLVTTEPGSPHGDFLVTAYRIDWVSLDGITVPGPRVEESSFIIPSGTLAGTFIRLMSIAEKENTFSAIGATTHMVRAEITFYGHETGTERDTEVETSVTLQVADFVDGTADNCDEVSF